MNLNKISLDIANDLLNGNPLPVEIKEFYNQMGYVIGEGILTDLIPDIQEDIRNVVRLARDRARLPKLDSSSENFDSGLIELARTDRNKVGEIYDLTNNLVTTKKMSTHPLVLRSIQELIGTKKLYLNLNSVVRMDIPGEQKFLFPWHQDFPYTLGSSDGISIWAPLVDLTGEEGGLDVLPESHKKGILPSYLDASGRQGHYVPRLDSWLKNMKIQNIKVKAGDVIFFSVHLVHRSVPNKLGKIRWSSQFRYSNFENKPALERGWRMPQDGRLFKDQYPEFFLGDTQTAKIA